MLFSLCEANLPLIPYTTMWFSPFVKPVYPWFHILLGAFLPLWSQFTPDSIYYYVIFSLCEANLPLIPYTTMWFSPFVKPIYPWFHILLCDFLPLWSQFTPDSIYYYVIFSLCEASLPLIPYTTRCFSPFVKPIYPWFHILLGAFLPLWSQFTPDSIYY